MILSCINIRLALNFAYISYIVLVDDKKTKNSLAYLGNYDEKMTEMMETRMRHMMTNDLSDMMLN